MFDPWNPYDRRGALADEPDFEPLRAPAAIDDDETPAEELGRLRRELSELDPESPEYRDVLDRIAVLVREAAERRRDERRASVVELVVEPGFRRVNGEWLYSAAWL